MYGFICKQAAIRVDTIIASNSLSEEVLVKCVLIRDQKEEIKWNLKFRLGFWVLLGSRWAKIMTLA